jgi:hypothetical protein
MLSVREQHNQALVSSGFGGLAEPHETQVRAADGTVTTEKVDIAVTNPSAERVVAFGIDTRNEEALNLTFSLTAIGYRPRLNGSFLLDGGKWKVRGLGSGSGDVVRITVSRSTS